MAPITRSQTRRNAEAGPQNVAHSYLTSIDTVSAPTPRSSSTIPNPPLGLLNPGPIDTSLILSRSSTSSEAIRDACRQSVAHYRATGTLHTRPVVISSSQSYLIAAEPMREGGYREEIVCLNAGTMIYNPVEKKNSFQLGHAYIRFYPFSSPLPLVPQAALEQRLTYTYAQRNPVTPEEARAELEKKKKTESEASPGFFVAGPFTSLPRTKGATTKTLFMMSAPDEESDDPEMPDLMDDAASSDSEMAVDKVTVTNDNVACQPPSPASLPDAQQNVDNSAPELHPSLHVPVFLSRLHPNKFPSDPTVPLSELERTIIRPDVGQPVFELAEKVSEKEPWEMTSILHLRDGHILYENPREYRNRVLVALRVLYDEMHFQIVEEASEEFFKHGEIPDMLTRCPISIHFQDPVNCIQLTNRFRYQQTVAHMTSPLPLLFLDNFVRDNWARENEYRGVAVMMGGRWKYRRTIIIAIMRQVYRAMVFITEYLLLRKADHLFRSRFSAYLVSPESLNRFPLLLTNRLLLHRYRVWFIAAWEVLVYLREVEMSAFVQYTLRLNYHDSGALDNLHRLGTIPKLPVSLPGTIHTTWTETLSRQEASVHFKSHVPSPPNSPISAGSTGPIRLPSTLTLSAIERTDDGSFTDSAAPTSASSAVVVF